MIEIIARATAVALRPTAVSEGRLANRHVVQWQWAQCRRRRLTGQNENEWAVLTTLAKRHRLLLFVDHIAGA